MNGTDRQHLLNVLLLLQIGSACSLCNMPSAWLGSWYQRGMSSLLEITNDHFQTKGRCLDVQPTQQYYLFTDRSNRCTRCLLFIQRHINLLQYRESECSSDADDLSTVASCPNLIAPDAELYTLHRNGSKPQLCPIQAPFTLINYVKDGSGCRQSISSYIGECANDHQFRLHLASCSAHQQSLDLQFVCVGTWIEGFHTYFVARILPHANRQHNDNKNQYACFHFPTKNKGVSNLFPLGMATDDSCRDLNSKYTGTVMTLLPSNRPNINESSCMFSNELQQRDWYSLNGTIQTSISNSDIELIDVDGNSPTMNRRFHCVEQIGTMIYRIRAFTNCHVTNKCLRIIRRTFNVIELITADEQTCNNDDLTLTLFTKSFAISDSSSSSCPTHIGHITLESNEKSLHMSIGCDNARNKLTVLTREKDFEHRSIIQTDTCLASWQSDDFTTTYLIGQSSRSNTTYCLSFHLTDPIVIRNASNDCSFNKDPNFAIYSARTRRPCSRSSSSSSSFLWILILFLFSNVSDRID